ncbi:MAG: excinuclease ABC subunit UvrA, partial [Alphaproteobacteria bacterium]|nr:excinuclease ABC subunit UvrA [Alphaproteobacteria bacterium]
QKTTNNNPRSTVGTTTEIYDFLRLLYSKIAVAYSYNTNLPMVKMSKDDIIINIQKKYDNQSISLFAPLVIGRKGIYTDLFNNMEKLGFVQMRVDGKIYTIQDVLKLKLDRYKNHNIEVLIDQIKVTNKNYNRLLHSMEICLEYGNNSTLILDNDLKEDFLSLNLMCKDTGISYPEPSPNSFSFNSPFGWCESCKGLGFTEVFSLARIVENDTISIAEGALKPVGPASTKTFYKEIAGLADKKKIRLTIPFNQLKQEEKNIILFGEKDFKDKYLNLDNIFKHNCGIIPRLNNYLKNDYTDLLKDWAKQFIDDAPCLTCQGKRLNENSRYFKINNLAITDLAFFNLNKLLEVFDGLENTLSAKNQIIVKDILKEIRTRIQFMLDVGLDYLHMHRNIGSLSGGESQRIRLATQIGSQLQGVTFILDEPSIGLHQRDNHKLIHSLKNLTAQHNTVIVIEHDKDIMEAADFLIDIGPGAGKNGGNIITSGKPSALRSSNSITAEYLNGVRKIEVPKQRRKMNTLELVLEGASGNNLKNVNLTMPLGKLIVICGVSGSGKSSLIFQTLIPALQNVLFKKHQKSMPYKNISGYENLDKIIEIDQKPIGRTPRSNPATYVGFYTEIRELFAATKEAKSKGYKIGRFSFNVTGGRCETCSGSGVKTVSFNFLPDVQLTCETCNGQRFNRETLLVKFKGKSINDVLNLSIEDALDFFKFHPKLYKQIKTLYDVGLGYISLGQSSTTLSGGEAQRIKLATELIKRDTGKTLYILDEPTTGLHFQDIQHLIDILQRIVDRGNSVVVIEHNLDIIKVADYLIELGPEGGDQGGKIMFTGTPEAMAKHKHNCTGTYLKSLLI